jgi:hypothetical protein
MTVLAGTADATLSVAVWADTLLTAKDEKTLATSRNASVNVVHTRAREGTATVAERAFMPNPFENMLAGGVHIALQRGTCRNNDEISDMVSVPCFTAVVNRSGATDPTGYLFDGRTMLPG